MSIKLMTKAFDKDLKAQQKLILLALCDFANDEGECHPSATTIAKKATTTSRTVKKWLNLFEKIGLIKRIERKRDNGSYKSSITKINVDILSEITQEKIDYFIKRDGEGKTPYGEGKTPSKNAPLDTVTVSHGTLGTVSHGTLLYEPPVRTTNRTNKKNKQKKDFSIFGEIQSFKGKTINSSFLIKILGVDEQVAEDWLTARKTTPTKTALLGILREAEKAGISLGEAITFSAENGWQGFKAEWLKNSNRKQGKASSSNQNISEEFEGRTPKNWGNS